jgi:hypothetical protein
MPNKYDTTEVTVRYMFGQDRLAHAAKVTSVAEVQEMLHRLTTRNMDRLPFVDVYIFADGAARAYYRLTDATAAVGTADALPSDGMYLYYDSSMLCQYLYSSDFATAWVQAHIEDAKRTLAYWEEQES